MSNKRKLTSVLCAVQTCKASRRTHPERKFFKFPSDQKIFHVWLEKCALKKVNSRRKLEICEKHFDTKCIVSTKLAKNSIPEYYLSDPNIISEGEIQSNSSQTLNVSIPKAAEFERILFTNEKRMWFTNESVLFRKKYIASLSSLKNITCKMKRFAKLIKYYKRQINFLKKKIMQHRTNKSEIKQIDSLPNMSLPVKEFGNMILNDPTRDWPCIKCMEDIKFASKSKEDNINSDDTIKLNVNNTVEESISNLASGDEKNSEREQANLIGDKFKKSLVDLNSGAKMSENDSGVQVSIEQSIATPDLYECEKCNDKFITYKGLIHHRRLHPDVNLYECERCGKEFRLGSVYRRHSFNHKSDKPFICQSCKKGFKSLRLLQQHELTHKKNKIVPCPHCDKLFCHEKALKQHLAFLKEKQIACTMCDKKFQYNSLLKVHMDVAHGLEDDQRSKTIRYVRTIRNVKKNLQKQFACEKCGKLLSTDIGLKRHIRCKHNMERPFQCSYCSKSFGTAISLQCHIQHHINSKNSKMDPKTIESYLKYKCDECDKAFTTSVFLKNHKIRHSGSKDYVCTQCGKGFAFKWYLVRHVRLVHDKTHPRNIICSICRKVSANIYALESHMLSHTGETPFHCTFCDSKFRYKKSLQIHVSNKHASKS